MSVFPEHHGLYGIIVHWVPVVEVQVEARQLVSGYSGVSQVVETVIGRCVDDDVADAQCVSGC
jgi:hypothetical protein